MLKHSLHCMVFPSNTLLVSYASFISPSHNTLSTREAIGKDTTTITSASLLTTIRFFWSILFSLSLQSVATQSEDSGGCEDHWRGTTGISVATSSKKRRAYTKYILMRIEE